MYTRLRFRPSAYFLISIAISCLLSSSLTQASTWTKQIVDPSADVGQFSSIDTDSSNNAHIAYHDNDADNLKYATNKSVLTKNFPEPNKTIAATARANPVTTKTPIAFVFAVLLI